MKSPPLCHLELQVLALSFNQFTGFIPEAIGSLSNLEHNKMAGGIPKEMGNLRNLNILSLTSSGLSGLIPAEIFKISSLQKMYFLNNSLSKSLPMDICYGLPKLKFIDLSGNELEGEISSSLSCCHVVENSEYYLYHSHWRHTTSHGKFIES